LPSLDDAAEVVAIVRQDHTFEFQDLLKDREELYTQWSQERCRRSASRLRYQCEAPEVLQVEKVHRNAAPVLAESPTFDPNVMGKGGS